MTEPEVTLSEEQIAEAGRSHKRELEATYGAAVTESCHAGFRLDAALDELVRAHRIYRRDDSNGREDARDAARDGFMAAYRAERLASAEAEKFERRLEHLTAVLDATPEVRHEHAEAAERAGEAKRVFNCALDKLTDAHTAYRFVVGECEDGEGEDNWGDAVKTLEWRREDALKEAIDAYHDHQEAHEAWWPLLRKLKGPTP
jgi:hypothetical protein